MRSRPGLPCAQWALLAVLLLAVAVANIAQPYPQIAPLHHAPTLLLCALAPWLLRRWPLGTASVALLCAFLLLHTLGGRYTYSNVPYEAWLGDGLSPMLGAGRNGYDRLVHFMFGLLCTPAFAEIAHRHGGMGRRAAWFFGFALVGLAGALYEIFEWLLSIVAVGETADFYNGQQGDMWDPQKDMALAQIGSALALLGAWLGSLGEGRKRV